MKSFLALSFIICFAGNVILCGAPGADLSAKIIGKWLGPRKFVVFMADGTWGVQRNEESEVDSKQRRWRVTGDKLTMRYPSNNGVETAHFTIVLLTDEKLILKIGDYAEDYKRVRENGSRR